MKSCIYLLNIDGRTIRFENEHFLNKFVQDNLATYITADGDIAFSISMSEQVQNYRANIKITPEQEAAVKNIVRISERPRDGKSLGVSSLIESKIMTSGDYDYIRHSLNELKKGASQDEIKTTVLQSLYARHVGDVVHAAHEYVGQRIYDLALQDKVINKANILNESLITDVDGNAISLHKLLEDFIDRKNRELRSNGLTTLDSATDRTLNSEQRNAINAINDAVKNGQITLQNKDGDISAILDEAADAIISFLTINRHLDQKGNLQSLIFTEQKIYLNDPEISGPENYISGILDMLIIDPNGKVTIYDYKTSRKTHAEWNPLKRKHTYAQQRLYEEILAKSGLSKKDISIFIQPLQINFTIDAGGNIQSIAQSQKQNWVDYKSLNEDIPDRLSTDAKIESIMEPFVNVEQSNLSKISDEFIQTRFSQWNYFAEKVEANALLYLETMAIENGDGTWTFEAYEYDKVMKGKVKVEKTLPHEEALKYITENITNEKNITRSKIISLIGEKLAAAQYDPETLESLGKLLDWEANPNSFDQNIIRRYFKGGRYTLLDSKDLLEQGILLFQDNYLDKTEGLRAIEVVVLTNSTLNTILTLDNSKNVLGNVKSKKYFRKDTGDHLTSTVGNIEALNAYNLLLQKPELFVEGNFKLSSLMMANPIQSTYSRVPLEKLSRDYKMLKKDLSGESLDSIRDDITIIEPTTSQKVSAFFEYLLEEMPFGLEESDGKYQSLQAKIREIRDSSGIKTNSEVLYALQNELQRRFPSLQNRDNLSNDPLSIIYEDLASLIAYDDLNLEEQIVSDISGILSIKSGGLSSKWFDNPSNIHDPFLRKIHQLTQTANTHIKQRFQSYQAEVKLKNQELLQNLGYTDTEKKTIGNADKYYYKLFRKDEEGNLDSKFRLKFIGDVVGVEKEAIEYYTKLFYIQKKKYVNPDYVFTQQEELEFTTRLMSPHDSVYNVPLVRKDTQNLIHKMDGVRKAVRKGVAYVQDISISKIMDTINEWGEEDDVEYRSRKFTPDKKTYFNAHKDQAYSLPERQQSIAFNGIDYFSVDLEEVALTVELERIKEESYNDILPAINIIKDIVALQSASQNLAVENLEGYIENMLENSIHSTKLYKTKGERRIKTLLSNIQGIATKILFTGNIQSLYRDLGDGFWRGFIESLTKTGYQPLKAENYIEAQKKIANFTDVNEVRKLSSINTMIGMSSMDISQLVQKNKSQRTGAMAFNSRWAMHFLTAGDYMNRMAFLTAHMLNDGVYDAMVYDPDTNLTTYDITKDQRFNLLFDSESDKTSEEYRVQLAKLRTLIEQLNSEKMTGEPRLKLDSVLLKLQAIKFPYSALEINSIKHMSDSMYGFFDKTERTMLQNSLLGSAFMQFSTYMSAAIDRYFGPSRVSKTQGKWVQAKDDNGNLLYRHFPDPYGEAFEVTTEAEGNEPLIIWEGDFMEGMVASFYNMVVDGARAFEEGGLQGVKEYYTDLKEAEEHQIIRANLSRFLRDMLVSMLMVFIGKGYNQNIAKNKDIPAIVKVPAYQAFFGIINSGRDLNVLRDVSGRLGLDEPMGSTIGVPSLSVVGRATTTTFDFLTLVDPNLTKLTNNWLNASKIYTNPHRELYLR